MSKILLVPLPAFGHIVPTLSLARYLQSKGYEPIYLTSPEFAPLVESIGACAETMPANRDAAHRFGPDVWEEFVPGTGRNDWGTRLSALVQAFVDGRAFELVLLDWQIVGTRVCSVEEILGKRRCLLFSTSLLRWNGLEQQPEFPMLIFCPEELEVPKFRFPCPGLHYVEPSLRGMEDEGNFRLDGIDPEKPLVLAAFGTHPVRYPRFTEQCKLIAELAARHPELQFVLGTGTAKQASPENFPVRPGNLIIVEKLPQRRLLESCKLFITHGGLSSIKEALIAGKPMVVLPALYDQPFNAMRVRYHNLGEAIFPEKLQLDVLEAAVLRAMDGRYNSAVSAMRDIFLARESARPSFAIIDNYLGGNEFDSGNNRHADEPNAKR